ncbi:Negative regulator of sexual conjugation and meiosis [Mycena kentingensis (nom. inval.)]|nr:Negative regulator of sexual conjugation and meiosis [Mycena kentingensis (nom. inval.)]
MSSIALPVSTLPILTGAFLDDGYLQLVDILGSGGNAIVYKALDTTSPEEDPHYYAVKCVHNDSPDQHRYEALRDELWLHGVVSDLGAPGIVRLSHTFNHDCSPLIMDGHYTDRPLLVQEAFIQLLDAVGACHAANVFHRDIKPDNILCGRNGLGIRLADFGMATDDESALSWCGTTAYMTPEGVAHERSSTPRSADLWALSVTLYATLTGLLPWSNPTPSNEKYAAYREDPTAYLSKIRGLTPAAVDFFQWCWAVSPDERPTLQQMRAFISSGGLFRVDLSPPAPVKPVLRVHIPQPVVVEAVVAILPDTDSVPTVEDLLRGLQYDDSSSDSSDVECVGLPNTDALPSLQELLASDSDWSTSSSEIKLPNTDALPSLEELLSSDSEWSVASNPSLPNSDTFPSVADILASNPSNDSDFIPPSLCHQPVRPPMVLVIPPPFSWFPETRFLDENREHICTRDRFNARMFRAGQAPRNHEVSAAAYGDKLLLPN